MKNRLNRRSISLLVLALMFLVFSLWYHGNTPLTDSEINQFLGQLELFEPQHRDFIKQTDIQEFLANDDGKAFYVVNLFKFKPNGGEAQFAEFSSAVVPLWLGYGTHPVFASSNFLSDDNSWDRITIVRYRSRRDWLEIVSSDAFVNALPSRLAATENNHRYSVSGVLVPNPLLALGLGFLLIASLVFGVQKLLQVRVHHK